MAKSEDRVDEGELDERAFRLYAERMARMPTGIGGEQSAKWAYQRAQEFLAVRDRVRAGESVTAPTGPQLSFVAAPNLKPTHPYNLVSQRFGDVKRVKMIWDWLQRNPRNAENSVSYRELEWDVPTTNLARELFAPYAS